ncbi:MAG: DNA primase [Gammaproteobacteria bacterium]|nr:DNA primase [Gammaproteobacteria bacterium]QOJ30743.1 MAG: DNA primase [Gammaproteobacteria bacterium]
MAGRIPQHFIDELMQRADIVEIIGSRIQLKKAGRDFKACCPFHGEKTPSFTVSPAKGFYHCFGCGAHGTALGFLMEYDRLEFVPAVEELAARLGLEVPREDGGQQPAPLAPLYAVLDRAAGFFEQALRAHPGAIDYLRGRGLDGETAKGFRIGYAPPGWDGLLTQFDGGEETHQHLLAAGLIVAREGASGYYDRFRDRIMFPIRDSRGRVIGFGGRVLGSGEPKYLNSPETPVFHKGQELYGLYEARQAERRLARLLVVEGYMDAVSLARHGIRDVVATLGTATTGEHLRRLFRVVPEVVFCFDGDRAGRAAAWRALQATLPELRDGRQARFLFLPEGEDPDSLVGKEGAAAFGARLGQATPLSEYLLEELRRQAGTDSLDGRARLAELARPLVGLLPAGVYRELLADRLAQEVGLQRERLAAALGEAPLRETPAPPRRRAVARQVGGRTSVVGQAIALVLSYPQVAATLDSPPGLAAARIKGAGLLAELLQLTRAQPGLNPGALLERFRDRAEGPHLAALLAAPNPVGEAGARAELADSLQRILALEREERLASLASKAAAAGLTAEEKEEFRQLQRSQASGTR